MDTYIEKGKWTDIDGRDFLCLMLLFVIWPFGAWLYSLYYISKTRSAYIVFFLFSLLICWHFSPSYTSYYDDFLGILKRYQDNIITTDSLVNILTDYFDSKEGAKKEIYEYVLNWFSRLFTNNYHFYFFIASFPVAICQLKVMKRLTGDERFVNASIFSMMVLALFIFPRDIVTVQNFRFATGFWLTLMGTVSFYCHNSNGSRYWQAVVFIMVAPLCHSALLVYWPIFIGSLFARANKLLVTCAMVSIAFTFFDANLYSNLNLSFLPSSIQTWATRYMSDDAYNKHILHVGRAGFWWVQWIIDTAIKTLYVWMTVQLIKNEDTVYENKEASSLYSFYLVLFTCVNMIQFVPEL